MLCHRYFIYIIEQSFSTIEVNQEQANPQTHQKVEKIAALGGNLRFRNLIQDELSIAVIVA